MSPRLRLACSLSLASVAAAVACTSASTEPAPESAPPAGADAAAGGDGASDAGPLDPGPFDAPFTCKRSSLYEEPLPDEAVFERFRIALGVDALEQREARVGRDGGPPPDAGVRPGWPRAGTPCAGATDRDACAASFAALSRTEALYPSFFEADAVSAGFDPGRFLGFYLAYSKGDAVGSIATLTELQAIAPVVDSPEKAFLRASNAGYRVECLAGWVRADVDGFVLVASRGHEQRCIRVDVILHVSHDGKVVERAAGPVVEDSCS